MTQPDPAPSSGIVLYQTEDGQTRIQCRFQDGTIWLTQALMADLFQTTPQNITIHLKSIYDDGELHEEATCKDYLQVRREGPREVSRSLRYYNLAAILAVGFRVRSQRGTQFRQWATARLEEYLVKGFVMDDERLKNPPGPGVPDYFDELLEEVPESVFQRAKGPVQQQPRATPWVYESEFRLALKGRPNRWSTIGSPFQGSTYHRSHTQGVALGCHGAGRWPSRCDDRVLGGRL